MQEKCGCRRPDITIFEMCRSCGNPVNFEDLQQRSIDTYDRDGRPIEDLNLPRRHLFIGNPTNSLRLLHLDDDASPVLSGTFERASITNLPSYEAVSYCWGGDDGDYTKSEFIIIGGRLFPITKNCAAVLRQIRKKNTKRVIWIDSLCINQNDVNERSVQVSQMGQIFSGARKVHIYLGNNVDNRTVSKAFYVLESMQDLHEFSMRLRKAKMSIKALFTQTYFSRMWIIQEVLLARSAELHWGTATIPWQTFSEGHLKELEKSGIDSCIPEWMRIRATTNNFRSSETLGDLLFSAMGSTASNDRDKVYGIYGLLFDAEEEGLTVDYSLSVKQVFTNMAAHLIAKHNGLRAVLRHVGQNAAPVDGEQLPSWVPDFRSKFVFPAASMSYDGFDDLKIQSSVAPQEPISSCGTNELFLRGHRLVMHRLERASSDEDWKIVTQRGERGEIRARFQVAFDPDDHTIFWMPDGVLLQMKRHPTREDAYVVLGECAVKQSGTFPAIVVNDRGRFFGGPMLGFSLHDLLFLWNLCMDMECISHSCRWRLSVGSLKLPDTSMGWEKASSVLSAPSSPDVLGGIPILEHDAQTVFDFLSFCQRGATWLALERARFYLWSNYRRHQADESMSRTISELCLSWLQCYEEARNILGQFPERLYEDSTRKLKFWTHLNAWEKTAKSLSKALLWAPFCLLSFPVLQFDILDYDEDEKEMGVYYKGERIFNQAIEDNFKDVRMRFNQSSTGWISQDKRVDYILEPWGEEWNATIRSIPHLLVLREKLGPSHFFSLRQMFTEGGWRSLLIGPAETITLL